MPTTRSRRPITINKNDLPQPDTDDIAAELAVMCEALLAQATANPTLINSAMAKVEALAAFEPKPRPCTPPPCPPGFVDTTPPDHTPPFKVSYPSPS